MKFIYTLIPLCPLLAAIAAGMFGRQLGRTLSHRLTIAGVAISFLLSLIAFQQVVLAGNTFNESIYTWMISGGIKFEVGFLVDKLTVLMMLVVTFVSLMVHIYTIGYMHEDDGYQRFFCYISLFTFSMLMLVMANNFMQLFFGWEAVGTVSYLLIGFWYTRDTAIFANMKAFLVNRVGDFGFILGIAAVVMYTGSLDYEEVFVAAQPLATETMSILGGGAEWSVLTVICICLFIGAMGKSAQMPLHVWLPDSMEGPTPISALIHAATMVTAGIFMVARMSPLFEMSETALSFVLVIGALTAFLMGLIGIVQHDIKRVVAYSTLSQLGYMTVALGASAYSAAIFHLMTHAFFKALLFLAAGSVIIAMHHEQDMRKMGGLKKYLPITYWTSLIGSLALIGFPGLSGFFSKDLIIEAVHESTLPGSTLAYWAVLGGVFVTAFYSFRMFFLVFHGKTRMDKHTEEHCHEPPKVVTWPLIALAVPSVLIGFITVGPVVFGSYFEGVIFVDDSHNVIERVKEHTHGAMSMLGHIPASKPFYLAMAGLISAWFLYMVRPTWPEKIQSKFGFVHRILDRKYGFDEFNQAIFAGGSVGLGKGLWKMGDQGVIDGVMVNGSAKGVGLLAGFARLGQTGYLFHYAFAMIIGLLAMMTWFLFS